MLEEFSTLIMREGTEDTMFLFGGFAHIAGNPLPQVIICYCSLLSLALNTKHPTLGIKRSTTVF